MMPMHTLVTATAGRLTGFPCLLISIILISFRICVCQNCRTSLNATEFERQLHHLHYQPNNVQFLNTSDSLAIDNSRCNNPNDVSPVFLNERSLCPWDLVQDINENRYPQVLNFARCRCSKCLQDVGNFECIPVSYRIPVLEKKCIGDTLQYIKTFIDVPVGCTCSRPRVLRLGKRRRTMTLPGVGIKYLLEQL